MSDRENPDYPNSIKESISAVESISMVITGDDSGSLGELLKVLEKKHSLAPTLKGAFSKLYGYTSNVGGIRHGLKDDGIVIGFEEARFVLVTCTSFVNYLAYKM